MVIWWWIGLADVVMLTIGYNQRHIAVLLIIQGKLKNIKQARGLVRQYIANFGKLCNLIILPLMINDQETVVWYVWRKLGNDLGKNVVGCKPNVRLHQKYLLSKKNGQWFCISEKVSEQKKWELWLSTAKPCCLGDNNSTWKNRLPWSALRRFTHLFVVSLRLNQFDGYLGTFSHVTVFSHQERQWNKQRGPMGQGLPSTVTLMWPHAPENQVSTVAITRVLICTGKHARNRTNTEKNEKTVWKPHSG